MTDTPETKHATLRWLDGMRFEGGEPGGPQVVVDADNATAPGPMLQLLLAAASCAGADVVSILKKMQVGLESVALRAEFVEPLVGSALCLLEFLANSDEVGSDAVALVSNGSDTPLHGRGQLRFPQHGGRDRAADVCCYR